MAQRKRKARKKIDTDNLAVVFEFGEAVVENQGTDQEKTTFKVEATRTYSAAQFTSEIKNYLLLHGLAQKLGDTFANPEKNPQEAADEVFEQLAAGNWNARGDGLGGIAVEAFAQVKGIELDEATRRWNAASDEVRKNAAKAPAMVEAMARIRAERAAKKSTETPDANKALEGL